MPFFSENRKKRKISNGPLPPPYTLHPPPLAQQHSGNSAASAPPFQPTPSRPYLPTRPPPQSSSYGNQPERPQEWTTELNRPTYPSRPTVDQTAPSYDRESLLYDTIGDKFSDLVSLIDEGSFHGDEHDLAITLPETPPQDYAQPAIRGGEADRALFKHDKVRPSKKPAQKDKAVNVFSKLDLYLNSRLPASLPPLRLYMPTYPLLCLAAQYSEGAYLSPQSRFERKDFVSADGRLGTKAMVIKSVPCDDKKTLVFAIRGTSMLSIRDWGVNLDTEPVSPQGFLDDAGNLCHAGFLRVAKAMVKPIASRLRSLLQENPNRTSCSLLITGHSAGGAVASLLYAHMISTTARSELSVLTDCFKRVHCVTFGAPPISLLPLQKPNNADDRLKKCLFHSFMNEGDPVVRADRAYVRSLLDLLATPFPTQASLPPPKPNTLTTLGVLGASMSRLDLSLKPGCKPLKCHNTSSALIPSYNSNGYNKTNWSHRQKALLWWDVPPATLSNAGRLVVLRVPPHPRGSLESDAVTACLVADDQLRQVVFGDPLMHAMELYRKRIEALAVRAVTGRLCT